MEELILSQRISVVEPFTSGEPLPPGGAADAALSEEIPDSALDGGGSLEAEDFVRCLKSFGVFLRGIFG